MASRRYFLLFSAVLRSRISKPVCLSLTTPQQETYEPFWEDLHSALGKKGVRIRSIWIADVAWQGQSGVINEDHLGNDREFVGFSGTPCPIISCF